MKKAKRQYTIRRVPPALDSLLREKALREGRSLNAVALETLGAGAGLAAEARYADLDGFFGSWTADKAVEKALKDQRKIDRGLWR